MFFVSFCLFMYIVFYEQIDTTVVLWDLVLLKSYIIKNPKCLPGEGGCLGLRPQAPLFAWNLWGRPKPGAVEASNTGKRFSGCLESESIRESSDKWERFPSQLYSWGKHHFLLLKTTNWKNCACVFPKAARSQKRESPKNWEEEVFQKFLGRCQGSQLPGGMWDKQQQVSLLLHHISSFKESKKIWPTSKNHCKYKDT